MHIAQGEEGLGVWGLAGVVAGDRGGCVVSG